MKIPLTTASIKFNSYLAIAFVFLLCLFLGSLLGGG